MELFRHISEIKDEKNMQPQMYFIMYKCTYVYSSESHTVAGSRRHPTKLNMSLHPNNLTKQQLDEITKNEKEIK